MPVPEEQRIYAHWLDFASRTGLLLLAAAFLAYVLGLVDAHVPVQDLPGLWTLPLEEYLARTGAPTGWDWVGRLPKGEYLSLIGLAVLGLATLVCYVRLTMAFVQAGDRMQAAISIAQIAVLCTAALGLLAGH